MKLFTQLLSLIAILFLLIFGANFYISVNNIKGYLEGEAEFHAQDTATSLGLSIRPHLKEKMDKEDFKIIDTMIKAIFDSGYYKEIKLVDIEGQEIISYTSPKKVDETPDFFISSFPMKVASAESEIIIADGWSIGGCVYVTVNPGHGYSRLYEQVKNSFGFSLGLLFLSFVALYVLLQATLMSLKKIEQLASDIAEGEYEKEIHPLPWTTDIKTVAVAMNKMSEKISNAIKNLKYRLNDQSKKLEQDDLTGLYKKHIFETDIKKLSNADESDSYIYLIKADGIASLAKELNETSIDQFFKEFAEVLRYVINNNQELDISAYRFYGSEFILLAKKINREKAENIASQLSVLFSEFAEKYHRQDIAHIGVTEFDITKTKDILFAANEAYEQALLIGANSYYIRESADRAKDIAEWKSLVFSIIGKQKYTVSYVGQIHEFHNNQLLMEEAFTKVCDKDGNSVSIGTFVSIAEKFDIIVDLDIGVIEKVIDHIKCSQVSHYIAVNLSSRTIKNIRFRAWLVEVVNNNPTIVSRLVFNFTAYSVAKEPNIYKEFIEFAHKLKIKTLIKRYETQSISADLVKGLRPDFIRLSRDIGNGISGDEERKTFVETLLEFGDLLDISILAESIQQDDDCESLKTIGITGASRKI